VQRIGSFQHTGCKLEVHSLLLAALAASLAASPAGSISVTLSVRLIGWRAIAPPAQQHEEKRAGDNFGWCTRDQHRSRAGSAGVVITTGHVRDQHGWCVCDQHGWCACDYYRSCAWSAWVVRVWSARRTR